MEAFRWEAGVMCGLGDLGGGSYFSGARAVSADGAAIVGYANTADGQEAFRWTAKAGIVGLGDLPGGEVHSEALDISADGLTVVGTGGTAQDQGYPVYEAFRWTESTGMVGLGFLPGGYPSSSANMVSADGLVVVGRSSSESGSVTYHWTDESGMVALGDFAALAMSQGGSTIVGYDHDHGALRAIIWDEANGVRGLHELLEAELGLDLDRWHLEEAWGVSADGTVIVGHGTNPAGRPEGWVAVVPEPSTLVLLVLGVPSLCRRRWHRSVMVWAL
jgi:probable HAF family extracellular repeat protein